MDVSNLLCAPVTEIVKSWIGDRIGYIVHYKRNSRDLNQKVEELERMRNDVGLLVEAARRRGDTIKQVVEGWLASVDNIRDDAARLNGEVEQINNSWFKGWCCSRYDVGKEANEKIGTVEKLLNEGTNFSTTITNVSVPAPPPSSSSSTGDFHDFESTKSATKQIIEALKDENVNIIGVWGMPGVGKTTLIKEIGKKVERDELFDEVVLATVSQNPVLTKIQGEIAEELGMKLEEDSEDVRAGRLRARLKNKRVLVILDDVWERLELADLGISYHDHNRCRVLLTTRSRDVCSHMEAHKIIELKVLSKQDSWNLFRQKAGNVVDSPDLQTLATEVAAECGGLPLAIVTLGRALRGKQQKFLWDDALRQLKRSTYQGMMSPVFASVKLSYDYLKSEETKKCFLYCSFFPEDFKISRSNLMPYVMGDDLLQDVYTLEEAKARLATLFHTLMASCLLVKVGDDDDGFVVMMHNVVRDVALSIASKESNFGFIVKAGMGLTRWPHEGNLGTCVRLSLMLNQIIDLPDQPPECQQLLTLSLSYNSSFKKFPDNFFSRMTSLVTLDLMRTEILSLPPSLPCLVNLRVLRLQSTPLGDVSLLGKLKKLEMLNLSWTSIQRLPEEMRELTNLRSLDLSNTWRLESVPRDVLLNLSRLEELNMKQSFSGWETREMGGGSMARLAELSSLNRLTTLVLHVDNLICLSEDIPTFLENLNDFSIYVCEETEDWNLDRSERYMSLTTTLDPISNWVKVLLKRTYELRLYRCKGFKNVVELNACGFNNLKYLTIVECHEMDYPMSVVQGPSELAFSGLEELVIEKMELEAICNGALPNRFLEKLRVLNIKKCHKLIHVIPCDLLSRLQDLEELHVKDCDELKEIFQSEGLEEGHVMIPKLSRLKLKNLPKLTTIWKVLQIPTTSATRLRQSNSCDVSTSFPTPLIYPNLTKLKISSCGSLNYLFPVKLARGLVQLKVLAVYDCDEMEEIIVDEEEVDEDEDMKMFPQLLDLALEGLPKLSSFYKRRLLFDWPSLEFLYVENCQNLKRLPLGLQSAPTLINIFGENIEWFEGLEWEDESIKSRLQPLFQQA